MGHLVPGSIGVCNPEAGPGDLVDIVVDQNHLFRSEIGHRIDALWDWWDGLQPREVLHWPRIPLLSRRKDDLHLPIIFSTGFKKDQGSPAVDVQILDRVPNAIHMVHLTGQMKDEFLIFHQIVHRMFIPDIAEVDLYVIHDLLHIEKISSQTGHHIINDRHSGSQLH